LAPADDPGEDALSVGSNSEQRTPAVTLARVDAPVGKAGAHHAVSDVTAVVDVARGLVDNRHVGAQGLVAHGATGAGGAPASHGEGEADLVRKSAVDVGTLDVLVRDRRAEHEQ
jgi:hypothetical protein